MALRNSLIRRNHKERSQPANRARLGLLEKHKDYVHRARDYKSKKDRIRKLREKAAFRNKDEFYWGMIKGKTKGGVHIQSRGNEALSNQFVRLLKTQDANYVRTQIAQDEARILRLKAQLQSLADLIPSATLPSSAKMTSDDAQMDMDDFGMDDLDGFSDIDADEDDEEAQEHIEKLCAAGIFLAGSASRSKAKSKAKHVPSAGHVVFAETRDEMDGYERHPAFSEASSSKLAPVEAEVVDLGWAAPVSRKAKGKSKAQADAAPAAQNAEEQKKTEAEARKHRDTLLESLTARQERVSQLKQALAQMEQQRILMGKGTAIKKRNAEKIVTGAIADEDREGGFEVEKGDEKVEWKQKIFKFRAERRK